ncbi:MAG: 5-oxoprolinase subunit PxpA [Pseudomonadota bacterium]|nr:5-oxoprolinase subunit PxpA [Pseudomonadota bacterium]
MKIDLNADLGEGFGPWTMADDLAMFDIVSSANIACGGHAGDFDTMTDVTAEAARRGVVIGAHPGYEDRAGFGRRVIPMRPEQITRMVASQIGALIGSACLSGATVAYVKPHGALANFAAADEVTASAILKAVRAFDPALPLLAISGTVLDRTARAAGHPTWAEIYADRAYLATGQLAPRAMDGAVLHDPDLIVTRLLTMLETGAMPTMDGAPIPLVAHSVCIHGDTPGAIAVARALRSALERNGVDIEPFVSP